MSKQDQAITYTYTTVNSIQLYSGIVFKLLLHPIKLVTLKWNYNMVPLQFERQTLHSTSKDGLINQLDDFWSIVRLHIHQAVGASHRSLHALLSYCHRDKCFLRTDQLIGSLEDSTVTRKISIGCLILNNWRTILPIHGVYD